MTNHLFEFTCIQLGVADNVTHCPTAVVDVRDKTNQRKLLTYA